MGYANPYKVQQVFDRNADEFTESMTQLLELQTAGGKQQVRIFSLRGCHLLGMLSRTKVAKDFRRWVLDVLEKETALPNTVETRRGLVAACRSLAEGTNLSYQDAFRLVHQRFNVQHIDELAGSQIGEACGYVHSLMLETVGFRRFGEHPEEFGRHVLYGEVLDAEPPAPGICFEELDVTRMATAVYYCAWAAKLLREVSAPLKALGYEKAVTMRTLATESQSFLRHSRRALGDILPKLTDDYYRIHLEHTLHSFDRVSA